MFAASIIPGRSSKRSESGVLTTDANRLPLGLRGTCGGTFGEWRCNGFAAAAGLDGPREPKDGVFLVNILAMVFSACFPGAGDGLLEGNSCFARVLLVAGRGGWGAAAACFATAFPNMVR